MANTKDYLDQEAYEEQKENVKNLIKNVGFDYTVDQLKALANAADRIIEISEDGINVTPGPYADGVGYGLSGIATTKSSISFLKNITKYMELEEQYEGKLDDPKVQGILNSQIAQCVADGISIVTSASGFSKILNNIPVVGLVMTTFTYSAEALSSGAAIIQSRLTYLEQLDRELDEALGWNDVADDSGVLIETYEDQVHYRNAFNKLKSARSELQSADIYDGSLDSVISDIESKLNALDQKANDVINKVENKSGYHASNLSDLANHATSEKNNSNGGDWTDTTTDETSDDANDRYGDSGKTPAPRDPLIIDLGKKGIELTNVENGVHFDIDKNGFAEKTAWTDGEDGFLVLDRNGNGFIDDGGELFSDQVVMKNDEISKDGFEALAEFAAFSRISKKRLLLTKGE